MYGWPNTSEFRWNIAGDVVRAGRWPQKSNEWEIMNTEAMAEFAEKLQPTETGWDLQKSDDSERILPFSQRPTMTREKAVGSGSDGDQRGLGSKVRIKTDIWKLLHKWGAGMVYHLLCNPAEILVILPRASFVRGCPVCLLMVSKHHPNAIHYAPWMRDGENQLKCRSSIDMAVCRDADRIGSMFGTSADHGMFDLDSLDKEVAPETSQWRKERSQGKTKPVDPKRESLSLATEVKRVGELCQHSKWGQSTTVSGQQIIFGGWYVNGRNTAGRIRIAKNGGGYEYGGTAELMAVMAGFDRCDGQRAGSGMNGGIDPGQRIYDRARRPM
ncbi:hypothetical protein FB45DRAFT_1122202 [Roridomyces roridus]|uniref:Uncharacterized protein n=1 Tax=Roridomyces roridus TaxID=1738132 RepID=A0AAD7FC71_9AGAR|nr:hypothetical protein FB45DRAFT_1122202 [Roridomyces roridus]